ncbi:MAG: sortase domain-containing protein [Nocardioides sp.]
MRRITCLAVVAVAIMIATAGVLIGLQTLREPVVPQPAGSARVPTPHTAAPAVGEPVRVVIPAIGVDEGLSGLGLEPDGAMTVPAFGAAGWYDEGPRPGDSGPAVVVAHVRGPSGPDVFGDLATLRAGDRITVYGTRGEAVFAVETVETVAKDELPYDRVWPATDDSLLRLITCGGRPDPGGGGFPANTIVYAHRI